MLSPSEFDLSEHQKEAWSSYPSGQRQLVFTTVRHALTILQTNLQLLIKVAIFPSTVRMPKL